jgi:hypothetical protein
LQQQGKRGGGETVPIAGRCRSCALSRPSPWRSAKEERCGARGAADRQGGERERVAVKGRLPDKAVKELVTEDDGAVGERDLERDEELEGCGVVAMAGSRRA